MGNYLYLSKTFYKLVAHFLLFSKHSLLKLIEKKSCNHREMGTHIKSNLKPKVQVHFQQKKFRKSFKKYGKREKLSTMNKIQKTAIHFDVLNIIHILLILQNAHVNVPKDRALEGVCKPLKGVLFVQGFWKKIFESLPLHYLPCLRDGRVLFCN